jgi:hypothetical protein
MTSMVSSRYYELSELENMSFSGSEYMLSDLITNLLNSLETEVVAQNAIETAANSTVRQTPDFTKKMFDTNNNNNNKPFDKKRHGSGYQTNTIVCRNVRGQTSNVDWERDKTSSEPIFKITKMETKEGVEKRINEIRVALNKISKKNYEAQKTAIIQHIDSFYENESNAETRVADIGKISQYIFDIASSNKFFSELYAELYRELIGKYDIFGTILTDFVNHFSENIQHIHYVNSDKDYDGYCNYVKMNDNRKATSTFIVNLMKNGILPNQTVMQIIRFFMSQIVKYIDEPDCINEVEEITENLFIFVSQSQGELSKLDEWTSDFVPKIQSIAKMKVSEHKSISNRVIFKYMDIVDSLNGQNKK